MVVLPSGGCADGVWAQQSGDSELPGVNLHLEGGAREVPLLRRVCVLQVQLQQLVVQQLQEVHLRRKTLRV